MAAAGDNMGKARKQELSLPEKAKRRSMLIRLVTLLGAAAILAVLLILNQFAKAPALPMPQDVLTRHFVSLGHFMFPHQTYYDKITLIIEIELVCNL
jgi:hypothetical protein